jgi:CCR4-NOT transcription complex subunit 3
LAEMSQLSTEVNIAGGQRVVASRNPGVIARRSIMDVGTTGNNLIPSCAGGNTSVQYDQLMNLQALDAAYHTLPLPKDSEGPCSYIPRCPKVTPGYYPQVQAPIVHSPALWEQLDKDVLFFAFYYQQVQLLSLVTKSQPWSEIMINTCILCLNTSQRNSNECKKSHS